MKRVILTLLIIVSCFSSSYSQSGVKDSVIRFPFVGVSYGIYQPGGDLSDRFGVTSMLSGDVLFKSKKNLLFGFSGGFMFGDKVKEPDLLKSIYTQNEQIIGYDGLYADVRIFERGYQFSGTFGKIFAFKKPNPNSGIIVIGGPGFLQHKIRIENVGNTAPQLTKEYLKGYDRLTNGLMMREFVGYVYFSNHQLVNFYAGLEFIQAFTQSRRDYNFDIPEIKDNEKRTDLLYGFKVGWILPLYKKKPASYYFY